MTIKYNLSIGLQHFHGVTCPDVDSSLLLLFLREQINTYFLKFFHRSTPIIIHWTNHDAFKSTKTQLRLGNITFTLLHRCITQQRSADRFSPVPPQGLLPYLGFWKTRGKKPTHGAAPHPASPPAPLSTPLPPPERASICSSSFPLDFANRERWLLPRSSRQRHLGDIKYEIQSSRYTPKPSPFILCH